MPKGAKQLSARAVAALKHNGVGRSTKHSVGGVPGLMLITFDTGGGHGFIEERSKSDVGILVWEPHWICL